MTCARDLRTLRDEQADGSGPDDGDDSATGSQEFSLKRTADGQTLLSEDDLKTEPGELAPGKAPRTSTTFDTANLRPPPIPAEAEKFAREFQRPATQQQTVAGRSIAYAGLMALALIGAANVSLELASDEATVQSPAAHSITRTPVPLRSVTPLPIRMR